MLIEAPEYSSGVFYAALDFCEAHGFTPRVQSVPNTDSLWLAVRGGKGFALVDSLVMAKDLPGFRYETLESREQVAACWKKTNNNPALRRYLDESV
jgi:DNA-binding transcriptional LysR family regulator